MTLSWVSRPYSLDNIANSSKFEFLVGIMSLTSVVLALILYFPEISLSVNQIYAIYGFDLIVVAVLAFDFCVRMKLSKEGLRYAVKHWYEIPAMLPLVVLAMFEDPMVIGAAIKSLRFIRLLRLMRLFRLINLFRTAKNWKLSTLSYLSLILIATILFGAMAISALEGENKNIRNFGDALWFAVTTVTISGFGDIVPHTVGGRIVAVILSFIGLAIIFGFIAEVGTSLVVSRLNKNQQRIEEEMKEVIKQKINKLEYLLDDDLKELIATITSLHKQVTVPKLQSSFCCLKCNCDLPVDSKYCNRCGNKI